MVINLQSPQSCEITNSLGERSKTNLFTSFLDSFLVTSTIKNHGIILRNGHLHHRSSLDFFFFFGPPLVKYYTNIQLENQLLQSKNCMQQKECAVKETDTTRFQKRIVHTRIYLFACTKHIQIHLFKIQTQLFSNDLEKSRML